jgi:hypothetical protein
VAFIEWVDQPSATSLGTAAVTEASAEPKAPKAAKAKKAPKDDAAE